MTRHIFLSPHLDDVILSCGGLLAKLVAQGHVVQVITIFAGIPPAEMVFSPFAQQQHTAWGDLKVAYASRRAEDKAALAIFNLNPVWLPFLDCIYRGEPDEWYYTSNQTLFGPIHPNEADLPGQIAQAIITHPVIGQSTPSNPISLYTPLGVGNHVDHQLTFLVAQQLASQGYLLYSYEDYPYIQRKPDTLAKILQIQATHLAQKHQQSKVTWQPKLIPLTSAELALKIEAIAVYASQLALLFKGYERMITKVRQYAHHVGGDQPAERLWIYPARRQEN